MSQRSHIAQSGSSAMRLCSAACSAPRSFGICSSPSRCSGSGQNQIASVSKVVSGMSIGTDVDGRAVAHGLPRVRDDLLGHGDPTEVELDSELELGALRVLDRRLGLLLHLRVPVDSRGRDDGDAVLERERLDEVLLAEMEVDGALVHGRVRAVALDEPEQRAGVAVDDRERLRVAGAERHASGRVVAAFPHVTGGRVLELGERRGPV